MKKLYLIFIFAITHTGSYAQTNLPINENGEIVFSAVIETSNKLSSNQIYDNFKEWLSTKTTNFNRSNSEKNFQGSEVWLSSTKSNFQHVDALYRNDEPLKLADKESNKIIGKIVYKYTGGTMGCIRIIYLESNLIVLIKDGRYKYSIENFTYTHYNQASGKQSQIYGMKDDGDCKSKGSLEELSACNRCKKEFSKFYDYLKNDVAELIVEMEKEIDKKGDDDSW